MMIGRWESSTIGEPIHWKGVSSMKLSGNLTKLVVFGLLSVLVMAAALKARPIFAPAQPTAVAVVDWLKVTDNLKEWKDTTVSLKAKETAFQQAVNDRQAKLKELAEDLKALSPETPNFEAAQTRFNIESAEFSAWGQAAQKDLEAAKLREQLKIYDKITKAVAAVAERDGYQIVLWNDAESKKIDLRNAPDSAGQIATRHVLYVSPSAPDITDAVAAFMNEAAGG